MTTVLLLQGKAVYGSKDEDTRYNLGIEFIIPTFIGFIEGSTCFERHTAHHQEL
jgi:hypothetical protein